MTRNKEINKWDREGMQVSWTFHFKGSKRYFDGYFEKGFKQESFRTAVHYFFFGLVTSLIKHGSSYWGYPGPRGFSWFFFVKEINSKPRSGDNESRKRRGEREKNLWLPWPRISLSCSKRVKLLIKRVTNGNLANTCLSAAIFLSGGRPGEIMLWTNHLTWVVKSDLLIGVKLKHVLTMGDKSPGIRRPLYKETDIVPKECCRICRIYLGIITRIFHKHCHLFCRQCASGKL